ncbi:MAG: single-stranded DNA-binding protein [Armatimonadota bacterium]
MKYNHIILVGRLTRDPEYRSTPQGTTIARISVAVDRNTKNKETGNFETDFFDCTAWQSQAEFAINYLKKGRLVLIDGRMESRKWTSQTGEKHTSWDVQVSAIRPMDSNRDSAEGGFRPAAPAAQSNIVPPVSSTPATGDPFNSGSEMPSDYDPFADES